jgi:hypothetical protein
VRGFVDVIAHTREAHEPRANRSCDPLPPALPSSSSSLSVSDSLQKNCPQLSNRPHKLHPCFQVPQTLRVFGEFMSKISTTRGCPDMQFVYVEAREEIFHT